MATSGRCRVRAQVQLPSSLRRPASARMFMALHVHPHTREARVADRDVIEGILEDLIDLMEELRDAHVDLVRRVLHFRGEMLVGLHGTKKRIRVLERETLEN